jgi:hypothetical protein
MTSGSVAAVPAAKAAPVIKSALTNSVLAKVLIWLSAD